MQRKTVEIRKILRIKDKKEKTRNEMWFINSKKRTTPPQCYSDNTLTIAPREIDEEKEEAVHYFSLFADLAGWKGEWYG